MQPKQKLDLLVIMPGGGYVCEGYRNAGCDCIAPYIGKSLVPRVLRELYFRLHLPGQSLWYNRQVLHNPCGNIIVRDPQSNVKYLRWLRANKRQARIFFLYGNLVGNARHILPAQIPAGIERWTFDRGDSIRYDMHCRKNIDCYDSFFLSKGETLYDVLFVGADKGRAEKLLKLQSDMEALGLKTCFYITSDGRYAFPRKKCYQPYLPYKKICELTSHSRAILNYCIREDESATQRDYEAAFNGVKLITNNRGIMQSDIYHENNVFILGTRPLSELPDFLRSPLRAVDADILDRHRAANALRELIESPAGTEAQHSEPNEKGVDTL
ncbi:MAG: hypothetical protein LLF96_05285 [Eubacteriales bacterium]|nr:hypothetical protein [Eubacteriales bacterium]